MTKTVTLYKGPSPWSGSTLEFDCHWRFGIDNSGSGWKQAVINGKNFGLPVMKSHMQIVCSKCRIKKDNNLHYQSLWDFEEAMQRWVKSGPHKLELLVGWLNNIPGGTPVFLRNWTSATGQYQGYVSGADTEGYVTCGVARVANCMPAESEGGEVGGDLTQGYVVEQIILEEWTL